MAAKILFAPLSYTVLCGFEQLTGDLTGTRATTALSQLILAIHAREKNPDAIYLDLNVEDDVTNLSQPL